MFNPDDGSHPAQYTDCELHTFQHQALSVHVYKAGYETPIFLSKCTSVNNTEYYQLSTIKVGI